MSLFGALAVVALAMAVSVAGMPQAGVTSIGVRPRAASQTFTFLIATDFLCGLPLPDPCPAVAKADNGDTIEITGGGTFSVFPKSVTGSGAFVHRAPDGSVNGAGTWEAKQMIQFQNFGNAVPQGLPDNFYGGRLTIRVAIIVGGTPVFSALLEVVCELGVFPRSTSEGVTLVVQGIDLNFNKHVSGVTLFLK